MNSMGPVGAKRRLLHLEPNAPTPPPRTASHYKAWDFMPPKPRYTHRERVSVGAAPWKPMPQASLQGRANPGHTVGRVNSLSRLGRCAGHTLGTTVLDQCGSRMEQSCMNINKTDFGSKSTDFHSFLIRPRYLLFRLRYL